MIQAVSSAFVLVQQFGEFAVKLGFGGGELLALTRVSLEVVEFDGAVHAVADGLPLAAAGGLKDFADDAGVGIARLLSEFPVEGAFGEVFRLI